MKKSEEIFSSLAINLGFKKDILFLNTLSDKLGHILDIYLDSKYRNYYHYGNKFAKLIDVEEKDSHRIWHTLDFLCYSIIPDHETNDIIEALNEITGEKLNLKGFIEKLKDEQTQNILKELDLIDDEIGTINPKYIKLNYNIQERKVLKDNKVIKSFPLVTLQIVTSKEEPDEFVVELLEEDLNRIIEDFNEIKRKLKIVKGK